MIYCEINTAAIVPGYRPKTNYQDYKELLLELHKIIEFIELHAPDKIFSISMQLIAQQDCIPYSLLNFIESHKTILFDIEVKNYPSLQQKFSEIYQQTLKKWFNTQIQKQKKIQACSLRNLVSSVNTPELFYLPSDAKPINHAPLLKWTPQISTKHFNPSLISNPSALEKQVQTFLQTYENINQFDEALRNVKDIFFPIFTILFANMGHEGLFYLLNRLKKLDKDQLSHLHLVMFRNEQEQNILQLAHPHCEYFLDIITAWPKNLFHNWLDWYSYHIGDPIDFIQSIHLLQNFWEPYQDLDVEVARLKIQGSHDYAKLFLNMSQLMTKIEPRWKKIQFKLIFKLDWHQKNTIFNLKNSGYHWISKEMLNTSHPLHQAHLYLSLYLDDEHIQSFDLIHQQIQKHQLFAEWIACISCLKPLLSTQEIETITQWFAQYPRQQELLTQLQNLTQKHTLPSDVFLNLQKCQQFENLLKLYTLWSDKNPQLAIHSWLKFMNFYQKFEQSPIFDIPFLSQLSFNEIYICCLLQSLCPDFNAIEILKAFSNYSDFLQKKLIQIFLSTLINVPLENNSILALFNTPDLNLHTEETFNIHFPHHSFLYFKKGNQWSLIIDDMKSMIQNLHQLLDKFSNPHLKIFWSQFSFKDFIKAPLIEELLAMQKQLIEIQKSIDQLEDSQSHQLFANLCIQFKSLEVFIDELLQKNINENLNHIYFLFALDKNLLDTHANFQQLFAVMDRNFQSLASVNIDQLFDHGILKLLGQHDSEQPILERIINHSLLEKISFSIISKFDINMQKPLIQFLGKLHLSPESIEHFFERIKALEQINTQWPLLSERLLKNNISAQHIWSICEKYQFINGKQYANSHWNICLNFIETFIDNPNLGDILHRLLKAQKAFPKKLSFNGEIEHPHWPSLLKQLEKDFQSNMPQNASFDLMLEYAIEHFLKTGEPLCFEKFSQIFGKLQSDARQKLLYLLENQTSSSTLSEFFKWVQMKLESGEKKWIQFIEKCLLSPDFDTHSHQLIPIFEWLETDIPFPALEIINEDEHCIISDMIEYHQSMTNLSPKWQFNQIIELKNISVTPLIPTASSFFTLPFITWNKPNIADQNQVSVSAHPHPTHPVVQKAWNLWKRPLRPPVKKINHWLSMSPDSPILSEELDEFDKWAHLDAEPLITTWDKHALKPFIEEIEFHTDHLHWDSAKKEYLLNRLQNIVYSIQHLPQSMTILLEKFHETKNKLMMGLTHSIELENQLISLIILIYKKTLQKQAYPTQILCLLLTLEYGAKNIIYEVDTSEGKSLITALLAVLKYTRKEKNTILVRTTHESLIIQDFYQKKHNKFFKLLGCHCDVLLDMQDIVGFNPDGIYYTTHLKFEIFNALSPVFHQQNFDMITDEVDEILDQNRLISIAHPLPQMTHIDWLYQDINEFVDQFVNTHIRLTPSEWLTKAFDYVVEKNRCFEERVQVLRKIRNQNTPWQKILYGAVQALEYLKLENQIYITQKMNTVNGTFFQLVPYLDNKPLFDFQLSVDGLVQCLAKRLENQKNIPFIVPALCEKTAYLNPFNHQNITRFIGLSGSNGKVIELNELTKIFEAQSIRIGRFKPKKLLKLPSIFTSDAQQQVQAIKQVIEQNEQPIVIFCENIKKTYQLLQHICAIPNKTIMCLTGQESKEEREQWLFNQEASHHAGAPHCVTIGISILARGIDYLPQHPKGLLGILTYLEENERLETQQNGRPARAGEPGQIIAIYNTQDILEKMKKFSIHHVSKELLPHHKALLQKHKIKQTIEQRHIQQLRLWCWSHLLDLIHNSLTTSDLMDRQIYAYQLFKIFEHQWEISPLSPKLPRDEHIEWMLRIWNKLNILFYIQKNVKFQHSSDDFKNELQLSFGWKQMINPDLQNHQFFIKAKDTRSYLSLQNLSHQTDLCFDYQIIAKIIPPTVPQWDLNWLDPLGCQWVHYLHEDWEIFKKNPTAENFSYLYEGLLAAKKLHEMQKQQGEFRLDYWFPVFSVLKPWTDFEKKITQILKIQKTQDKVHKEFYNLQRAVSKKVDKFFNYIQQQKSKIATGIHYYIQLFFDKLKTIMFTINPKANVLYQQLQKDLETAQSEKGLRHFKALHQSMNAFIMYIDTLQALPFWRLDKYYWIYLYNPIIHQIQDYHQNLSKEQLMLIEFREWLENKTITADFRLKCLGHFLCQKQILSNPYSIFNPQGQPETILANLQEEYLDTGTQFTHQKIYEIGRFFKKELQLKYMSSIEKDELAKNCKSQEVTQHAMYYELAKFVITKHIQDSPETQAVCAETHEQILENELLSAENNREFLCLL